MHPATTTDRDARRAAIRAQILADQATNAKRDEKALEVERQWCAQQAKSGTKK